ncbi:MAG: aldehyde-activating protein [Robiginitomaculum sp.]|nr:MAG: aldehyde-activating protein [Robiginitomaculum sp.]
MKEVTYTGSCGCGAVCFSAMGQPIMVANCHCTDCRHATGAAFSTFVDFKTTQIRWSGTPRKTYRSSPGVRRGFCENCGTPLSYETGHEPNEICLFIGIFDAPNFIPRQQEAELNKLSWVKL